MLLFSTLNKKIFIKNGLTLFQSDLLLETIFFVTLSKYAFFEYLLTLLL